MIHFKSVSFVVKTRINSNLVFKFVPTFGGGTFSSDSVSDDSSSHFFPLYNGCELLEIGDVNNLQLAHYYLVSIR